MLFKFIFRLAILLVIFSVVGILIVSAIRIPNEPCRISSFLGDGAYQYMSIVTYCFDSPISSLLMTGSTHNPILIKGMFLTYPKLSTYEEKFAYVVRLEWGRSIIYRYYEYDMITGKIRYLYRSPKLYGASWNTRSNVLFVKFDSQDMCYQYYVIAEKQLEKINMDSVPIEVQCAPTGCVDISMRSDICKSEYIP